MSIRDSGNRDLTGVPAGVALTVVPSNYARSGFCILVGLVTVYDEASANPLDSEEGAWLIRLRKTLRLAPSAGLALSVRS